MANFRLYHPILLGALLICVSHALANRLLVKPPRLPRLADWYRFVYAAQSRIGFGPTELDDAIQLNDRASSQAVLDASFVGRAVIEFMSGRDRHEATPTDFAEQLRSSMREGVYFDQRTWPATPAGVSNELRRIAPDLLREAGLKVAFPRSARQRSVVVERVGIDGVGSDENDGQ